MPEAAAATTAERDALLAHVTTLRASIQTRAHQLTEDTATLVQGRLPPKTTPPPAPGNPILADALRYYAERRTMNNPKGWAHVHRAIERAIRADLYQATGAQEREARQILGNLARHEAAHQPAGDTPSHE